MINLTKQDLLTKTPRELTTMLRGVEYSYETLALIAEEIERRCDIANDAGGRNE